MSGRLRTSLDDHERAIGLLHAAGGKDHQVISVIVEGQPIAKSRARVNGQRFYTPGRTLDAEADIAAAFMAERSEDSPFTGNIALAAIFYRSDRHRIDTDNLLKTVLDGITRSRAVWGDDHQVTALLGVLELDKERPRTVIAIGHHVSSLQRGDDYLIRSCEACGETFRAHGSKPQRFCSMECRKVPKAKRMVCPDCGGLKSAPHVERCRACRTAYRQNEGVWR